MPFKHAKTILIWMLSTKMLPLMGVLVPIYVLFRDFSLLMPRIGRTLVLILINLPIIVWMLYTCSTGIRAEILDAARMDGASLREEVMNVLTPMAIAGMAFTVLLNIIVTWNEAFWTINLMAADAAPPAAFISSYSSPEGLFYAVLSAASVMAIAPILIIGWFSQKQLGPDTFIHAHDTVLSERMTVRITGDIEAGYGDDIYPTPQPGMIHRFDANGRPVA